MEIGLYLSESKGVTLCFYELLYFVRVKKNIFYLIFTACTTTFTYKTILHCSILIMSDVRTICRTVPGLTKEQLELCYRANDVTTAALDGLELAVKECQLQVIEIGE